MEKVGVENKWNTASEFYRKLIEDYLWKQEPMRSFVNWISGGDEFSFPTMRTRSISRCYGSGSSSMRS